MTPRGPLWVTRYRNAMSAVTSAFPDSGHSPACQGCPLRADFCLRIRTERYRARRRQGTRCILVDVSEGDVAALVARSYLPEEASRDPAAIKAAIEGVSPTWCSN